MCHPAVIIAATALTAAGSIYSGFAQSKALKRSAAADRVNANTSRVAGLNIRNAAASTRSRVNVQSRASAASIVQSAAVSGVDPDAGSPMEAQIVNARNNMIKELDVLFQGDVQAQNKEIEAFNYESSAANKESQAGNAIASGFVNAAGSVAMGAFTLSQIGFNPFAGAGQPVTRLGQNFVNPTRAVS